MKKVLKIFIFVFISVSCCFTLAQDISIMPEWNNAWNNAWQTVRDIAVWWEVMERYKDKADELDLWDQFSSWIMNWDTILDYCVYLAKFLWQVALLVWALALIYLWYDKIWKSIKPESQKPIGKIILWILVVIFAYVIVRIIWSAFIS